MGHPLGPRLGIKDNPWALDGGRGILWYPGGKEGLFPVSRMDGGYFPWDLNGGSMYSLDPEWTGQV